MDALGPADEAHGGKPVTPAAKRLARRLNDGRVPGEAEIIIRAQVEHRLAVADANVGRLRGGDDALPLVCAGGANLVQLRGQLLFHQPKHNCSVAPPGASASVLPIENYFTGLARHHHLEAFLELDVMKTVGDDRLDVEAAFQHDGHLIPGLVHLAAVNTFNREHVEDDL